MTPRRLGWFFFSLLLGVLVEQTVPAVTIAQDSGNVAAGLNDEQLAAIDGIVEEAIRDGKTPGAVVLVGHRGQVVYRRAFGHRALEPKKRPMTVDTIFDLSSLTKVVATTPALLQLVERGKLRIDDPVAKYWPEFQAHGKGQITVRQLLTHYSGLPAELDLKPKWWGYKTALQKIVAESPIAPPGTRFLYSDVNFIILGELISRLSGVPLDVYCEGNIFIPLEMKDTSFKLPPNKRDRLALTQHKGEKSGKRLWWEVHDPMAYYMGGIAGHAGLFSTAEDLAIFAQTLLQGGSTKKGRILSPLMVEKMTTPQSPPNKMVLRGLGWDIDSPFSSGRGELFPVGAYGHTGYTGTSLWIDPVSETYIILLTNRVHPGGKGDVVPLRSQIATIVGAALGVAAAEQVRSSGRSLTSYFELMKSYSGSGLRSGRVKTGIDVLAAKKFAPLAGLRVGLITNHSGIDAAGRRTIDLIANARRVKLISIFSPEHGLFGDVDEKIPHAKEPVTGLPVYSLYGEVNRPTEKMLEGLDALIFDAQDAGVRYYTYVTTMAYAMEAAAKRRIPFYLLDRPNPINGSVVQGPVLDKDLQSFVGYFPMPVRHGMTVGELAQMFNAENKIGAKLHVIPMQGYERTDWYDETGLLWVNPSPNLRTLAQATLYPGVAMVEGANVSVGRGTNSPFELLGAPWINGRDLAAYLNSRKIQGVRFLPVDFMPNGSRYERQLCHGVQAILVDRQALDSPALGVEIASALYRLYPGDFQLDKSLLLIGSYEVLRAIKNGQDPNSIVLNWQSPLAEFCNLRSKYLLY
jgi:uncharacterized protein YbbC (DUF1343 family)/CubicO group peptidase (beta-lactamase class C family)